MTFGLGRWFKALAGLAIIYFGLLNRREGESDEARRERVKRFVRTLLNRMRVTQHLDEVILDGSNRLRFLGKDVLLLCDPHAVANVDVLVSIHLLGRRLQCSHANECCFYADFAGRESCG